MVITHVGKEGIWIINS